MLARAAFTGLVIALTTLVREVAPFTIPVVLVYLLWIRAEFLDFEGILPRRVVHGHTIMGDRPVVKANRISIDTGAFRSGILTAAVLDGGSVSFIHGG